MRWSSAVRSIALLEAAKGVLALAAGAGFLALLHRDLRALALELLQHLHLNPASRYPGIFLDAASSFTDVRLQLYAAGAACYAGVRAVEAWGLWFERSWAEWLAALSGGIYLPFEVHALVTTPGWLEAATFLVNLAVVGFMAASLVRRRRTAPTA